MLLRGSLTNWEARYVEWWVNHRNFYRYSARTSPLGPQIDLGRKEEASDPSYLAKHEFRITSSAQKFYILCGWTSVITRTWLNEHLSTRSSEVHYWRPVINFLPGHLLLLLLDYSTRLTTKCGSSCGTMKVCGQCYRHSSSRQLLFVLWGIFLLASAATTAKGQSSYSQYGYTEVTEAARIYRIV